MPLNTPTASEFANYVFRATTGLARHAHLSEKTEFDKLTGRITEANMQQYRALASQGRFAPDDSVKSWDVIHEGLADDSDKRIYECRFLTMNGTPLRCSPDLVLQSADNRKHKIILIVERKVRTGSLEYPAVPDGTWPNVRAQLWCYSWISEWDWLRDSNVLLTAEYYWRPHPDQGDAVYMGCRGFWKRSDHDFNIEARQHFEKYGGEVDPRSQMPS